MCLWKTSVKAKKAESQVDKWVDALNGLEQGWSGGTNYEHSVSDTIAFSLFHFICLALNLLFYFIILYYFILFLFSFPIHMVSYA